MKATSFAALLVALVAAGCGGGSDEATGQAGNAVGTRQGIDYAWSHPSPSSIRAAGYNFAVRYLSYDPSKDISAGEAQALQAAGVDVVGNWEAGATDALGGYGTGVSEAQTAEAEARAAGMPAGRPIYFSIDFDATPGDQAAINSYFDGVASVLGRNRTGAYGGYWPVKRLFDAGKITWGWQTYAWSGGNWDGRAQLRQVQNDIYVGGVDCDRDESIASDFGQWSHSGGGGPGGIGLTETGPAIATNADGRLEVFVRGTDNALYHAWQESPGGAWGGWAGLGGGISADPVVARNADGRLEVFARGTDNALYHIWQESPGGAWGGWAGLGGQLSSNATVGKNADGRLEVFVRGTDNALWHIWQTSATGWSGWASLGGVLVSNVTVGTNADGRLELFYNGTDKAIWHLWQNNANGATGWSGHASLGGYVAPSLAVARNADGRLELFVRGTDNAVYHMWQMAPNGGWSGWADLGGVITSDITVRNNADGRLEAFVRGSDNALWHIWQDSATGWSSWASLGGALTTDIAVVANQDGRLEAFYRGTDRALWHLWQMAPNAGWSGHGSLGGIIDP